MSVINLVDVGHRYPADGAGADVDALRGISFGIDSGEFVCVQGPSGAGKSTLLRILGCLDRPSAGIYLLDGVNVSELDGDGLARLRLHNIGFVFQDFQLLASADVKRNVELPATYLNIPAEERRRRAMEVLADVGIADKLDRLPSELSGGERQRVGIARALMNTPQIVLADEPTGALDSANAGVILSILEETATRGHAVVVASHDAEVAARAHRVVEIADGKVVGERSTAPRPPAVRPKAHKTGRRSPWHPSTLSAILLGLRGGRMRTAVMGLTAILGISLVILLMGLSQGVFGGVTSAVADMGAGRITVSGTELRLAGAPEEGRFEPVEKVELTLRDAELIESRIENVRKAYPQLSRAVDIRRSDKIIENVVVAAQSESMPRSFVDVPWPVARGGGLTAQDSDEARQVAVIGPTVNDKLFEAEEEPVGSYIQVGDLPFEIKGVLGPNPVPTSIFDAGRTTPRSDTELAALKEYLGTAVFVPFGTAVQTLFGTEAVDEIVVEVVDVARLEETMSTVRDLIVRTHGRDGVNVEVNATLADAYVNLTGISVTTLAGVGIVALLGTGLVVMSAMLMSVEARKQEIGLRIAFGARNTDVVVQFLGEALVVLLAGGAVGIGLAYLAGPYLSSLLGIPFSGEAWFGGAGLACAVVTGLAAGTIPAWRAGRTTPATWLVPR